MALSESVAAHMRWRPSGAAIVATMAALACALPPAAALLLALAPGDQAISGALLRDGALGTVALLLVGGGGAIVLGAASAWVVSLCAFPGRGVFAWLLATPLAAPSYVLAYAYSAMTWSNGAPIEVRGFWGAAFVYAVGLYPYVFLSARAAFVNQSASVIEAARSLGASPAQTFWRVAAPMARPGLVAGGALALMEIAADYGAAHHFGLTTLTTAIFRAWTAHQSLHSALQIAAVLLMGALLLLLLERQARGRMSFAGAAERWRPPPRYQLSAPARAAAFGLCAALVLFGAAAPLAWLLRLALLYSNVEGVAAPLLNSVALAAGGGVVTLCLAVAIAVAARRERRAGVAALIAAGIGYAAPGAVIALSVLSVFQIAREAGWVGGLGGALAIAALLWTYASRFAAAGVQPVDAGLARLSKGIDASARTLGANSWRRLAHIDLPIAAPSLAAAALIIFVEILKELPATLILRPFDFDTLAVRAYAYASDERLLEAAAPSLLIFAAGLAPIILLTRALADARVARR